MKVNAASFFAIALVSLQLNGCASVTSHPLQRGEQAAGLIYHLPKKYVKITYTVPAPPSTARTVSIQPTVAYPDAAHRFVARFNRNEVGKNELNVAVNQSGLLTSGNATTTSKLADVLRQAAEVLGTFRTLSGIESADERTKGCNTPDTYETTFELADLYDVGKKFCGISLRIMSPRLPAAANTTASSGVSGFFYRSLRLHRVEIEIPGHEKEQVSLLLPDESETHFIPVQAALFAMAKSELTFAEGMAIGSKIETESELIGLLKIPADVISGYASALGAGFTRRQTALQNDSKLEYELLRASLCRDAIAAGKVEDAGKHCK